MKVTQRSTPPTVFAPVTILLETQEEVDEVWAMFNNPHITHRASPFFKQNPWALLKAYTSKQRMDRFNAMEQRLFAAY